MTMDIMYSEVNSERDARLYRRLNRRRVTDKAINDHAPVTVAKRALNRARERKELSVKPDCEGSMDPDYALFLKSYGDHDDVGHSDDEDEDVKRKGYYVKDHDDYDNPDYDPDLVMCLNHLRADGTSYILEMQVSDRTMFVKYEEDDEFYDDLKRATSKNVKVWVPSEVKVKRIERKYERNARCVVKKEMPKIVSNVSRKGRSKAMTEKEVKVEQVNKHGARPEPGPKGRNSPNPKAKRGKQFDAEDDIYIYFLNNLKLDGDKVVLTTEDGKQIRYESDDGYDSKSDSDVVEIDELPHLEGTHTPFVLSKIYVLDCTESSDKNSSEFRNKLMDLLGKPFDQKEYDDLSQLASVRKPLEKHIELRGGVTKRCPTECPAKSYLDHHTDLKDMIKSALPNRYKALNILRCFFYWLENLSQDEAFRPWSDETCLKEINVQAAKCDMHGGKIDEAFQVKKGSMSNDHARYIVCE